MPRLPNIDMPFINLEEAPLSHYRGFLVYEKSGHVLTYNNGYYICSQKLKGKCSNTAESNIRLDIFKKELQAITPVFKADEKSLKNIFYELEKIKIDIVVKIDEEAETKINLMNDTLVVMEQDLKKDVKFKLSDIQTLKSIYLELLKIAYPHLLISIFQECIKTFGGLHPEPVMNQVMQLLIQKVYLNDNGKILKIKFEGWGDYMFQYLSKKLPDYLRNLKVPIVDRRQFADLDVMKTLYYFKRNFYRDTLSCSLFSSRYQEEKFIESMFLYIKNAKPKEFLNVWYFLKDYWRTSNAYFNPVLIDTKDLSKIRKVNQFKIKMVS